MEVENTQTATLPKAIDAGISTLLVDPSKSGWLLLLTLAMLLHLLLLHLLLLLCLLLHHWSCWLCWGGVRGCWASDTTISRIHWPMPVFMYGLCLTFEWEKSLHLSQRHSALTSSWRIQTSQPLLQDRACSTVNFTLHPSQWCCMPIGARLNWRRCANIIPPFLCSEDVVIIGAVWDDSEEGASPIERFFCDGNSLLAYVRPSVPR